MKREPITDQEFKEHLLSFRPLAPKPLTLAQRGTIPVWRIAAAMAIPVVAATLLMRVSLREPSLNSLPDEPELSVTVQPRSGITVLTLNRAAERGDTALESALMHQSRTILPPMDEPNSALSVLAQDRAIRSRP